MFYSTNEKSSSQESKGKISIREGIIIIIGVLCCVVWSKWNAIMGFYYENFETLYLIVYSIFAALLAGIAYRIHINTKPLYTRMIRLKPFSCHRDGIYAGKTKDGVPIFIPDEKRKSHVQIIGATGRGKTESVIIPWLIRDLLRGQSALLIDGKGDPELVTKLKSEIGKRKLSCQVQVFDLGNPEASIQINPLKNGTPQQITDRIFTAFEFQDPYYKSVQHVIAGQIIQLIVELGDDVTFTKLYTLLTEDSKLSEAVSKSKQINLKASLSRFLSESKNTRDQKLSGLLSQISPFAIGEVAGLVNGNESPIADILNGNQQTLFIALIPTLLYQEIGVQLGKLMLQELAWAVGERGSKSESEFIPVYLDEFSAFVYPKFGQLLNKARSSGVALHLSHQSLGDLEAASREFATVVNTNTNVKCLLGLNDPETADFFARHLGTETQQKLTHRGKEDESFLNRSRTKTGDVSMREVEAYKIHPNKLKNFSQGYGVLHFPTENGCLTEEMQFARMGGA